MLPINDLRRHNEALLPEIREAVGRVLDSGWYVLGPEHDAFEREFAAYCGVAECVGMANGSDAIELALRAVGVESGAEVVTVANAGAYSTIGIRNLGATPVYADVVADTLLMSAASAAAVLGSRTAAIVVTHLYGRLADMAALSALARDAGIPLVEDCAQAHGAARQGKRAGSFGAAGCFSFYPTKNLGALGDGGAVVTDDPTIAARLRELRQYGWRSKYLVAVAGGRNSRLDEMQAALLRVKLDHVDEWNTRRRAIANEYARRMAVPGLAVRPEQAGDDVAHLYVARCAARDSLRAHLRAHGIATDVHYPVPDHRQPAYVAHEGGRRLPVTEQAAGEIVTLPCFPEMTPAEIDAVIGACASWAR